VDRASVVDVRLWRTRNRPQIVANAKSTSDRIERFSHVGRRPTGYRRKTVKSGRFGKRPSLVQIEIPRKGAWPPKGLDARKSKMARASRRGYGVGVG
jgi:hypothetical protein